MGAGASVLDEINKPLDGSDVATPELAKAEVIRLRTLVKEEVKKVVATTSTTKKNQWETKFAVIGLLSCSDIDSALKIVDEDARAQVKLESRAPFFSVFGPPTPSTSGNAMPPETLTKSKIGWHAMFDSYQAYHDGEHEKRTATLNASLQPFLLTGGMMDFMGGFRGQCLHLENGKKMSKGSEESIYTVYNTTKAKDSESATKMMDLLKTMGNEEIHSNDSGLLRCTIFLTGGDLPEQFRDDVTIRYVLQFNNGSDYSNHMKTDTSVVVYSKVKEMSVDVSIVEFANTNHYEK
jgi:hypothetical protein